MPRQKDPRTDEAMRLYHDGVKMVEIAQRLQVPAGTVRRWKATYRWDNVCSECSEQNEGSEYVCQDVQEVMGNPNLTDKQKLFCLFYTRCFNATKAYQKAYECGYSTAATNGPALLKNAHVRAEIEQLKKAKLNRALLTEDDLVQKYIDIIFSDITDYVEFGQEEQPVMGAYGPIQVEDPESGERVPLTKTVNVVRFHNSKTVDGSLISEVSQGKDGAKIKLVDKMRALDWLAARYDLLDRATQRKLELEERKLQGDDEDNRIQEFLQAVHDGESLKGLYDDEKG